MPDAAALLAEVSAQVLALVGIGALAARMLRRSSAACRHALWTAVLAGALVIAVTSPAPPLFSLPVDSAFAIPGLTASALASRNAASVHSADTAPDAGPATTAPLPTPGLSLPATGDLLALMWMMGAAIFLLRIGAGRIALWRLAARSRPIESGPAHGLVARQASHSRFPRRVRLVAVEDLRVPATWGVLRPVVALPAMVDHWPAPRLEAALRHELAHVQRYDVQTRLMADLCLAILWFHPAVWFAARRMRLESECACDDAVVSAGGSSLDYAEWLVALADGFSRGGSRSIAAALAVTGRRELEHRLRALLDPVTRRSSPRILVVAIPAVLMTSAFTLAAFEVRAQSGADAAAPGGASIPFPPDEEITYGERLPLSADAERAALERSFQPRDEREAQALARLMEGAGHQKQHDLDLVRDRSVWALSIAANDEVVAPLVAQLASRDWRARSYAAWCLDVVGAGDARTELTVLLEDPVWRVRAMAATALAGLEDPRSTGDMRRLLEDPHWQVRLPAVEYLGRIGTQETLAAVRGRLNDPHIAVRSAARTALDAHRLIED